jgi:hypothetical protein
MKSPNEGSSQLFTTGKLVSARGQLGLADKRSSDLLKINKCHAVSADVRQAIRRSPPTNAVQIIGKVSERATRFAQNRHSQHQTP